MRTNIMFFNINGKFFVTVFRISFFDLFNSLKYSSLSYLSCLNVVIILKNDVHSYFHGNWMDWFALCLLHFRQSFTTNQCAGLLRMFTQEPGGIMYQYTFTFLENLEVCAVVWTQRMCKARYYTLSYYIVKYILYFLKRFFLITYLVKDGMLLMWMHFEL